jgi:hypothetical protein
MTHDRGWEHRKRSAFFFLILFLAFFGMAADKPTGERIFEAILSGDEEVPPVKTEAKGKATFRFSKGEDQLTYTLSISHIRDVTAAHIHKGEKGVNGPHVIGLFSESKKEDISGTLFVEGKIEPYLLTGPLKGKSLNALIELMEVGEAYVNVHTKRHPEGEIRGQIE